MSPPLISDYKKGFTVKRFSETFLGGPRIFFTPPVYIVVQMVLFALPAIVLSLVNLFAVQSWGVWWASIVIGLTVLVTDLSLALGISFLKRARRSVAVSPIFSRRGSTFLVEGEQAEYEGFFCRSTWVYVAPNATINEPLYVVGIIFSAVGFTLCTPLVISEDIGNAFLRGLSLFALCNTRYGAVISLPPEISTFDPIRQRNLLYRPFYVCLLGFGHLILTLSNADSELSFWLLLLLSMLPFLWTLGILPPLDALFPWLAESALKVMGGSPTYFYIGNYLALLIAIMCPVIVFISRLENVFIVLIECSLGYAISSDIGLLLRIKNSSHEGHRQNKRSALFNFLNPIICIFLSLLCTSIPMITVISDNPTEIILMSSSLTFFFVSFITRQFLIARVTRIPDKICTILTILDLILMLLLQFWVTVEISSEKLGELSLKQLVVEILTVRAFALSITRTRLSTLDLTITTLFKMQKLNGECPFVFLLFFLSILRERIFVFCRHLSFVGIVINSTTHSALLGNVCQKIGTVLVLVPYSIISLLIASLIEGSTLSTLFTLPIFLIGFPRPNSFWKCSWFPKSIVSNQGEKNIDWVIYSDIGRPLTSSFVRYFIRAHIKLEPGSCYIARYEDRLLFLRIVSSGWNFAYIQVKGLEMQEQTSCHHQEAAAMDEVFEKSFGSKENPICSLRLQKSLGILQPLMIFNVATYSESKASILNLKTKEERAVFRKMVFRTFSYLWVKSNPLFHGIDAYRKSVCSGYNLHSTENSSLASTPHMSSSRDNHNSFDFGMSSERYAKDVMFNAIDEEINSRSIGGTERPRLKNSKSIDVPAWTLSQLPTLPGMEFHKSTSPNENLNRTMTNDVRDERSRAPTNLLTKTWLNKCTIGDAVLSPTVMSKIEELCWDIWTLAISEGSEPINIDLQRFFSEAFVNEIIQKIKLGLSLADITLQAFRYAVKFTLDEIYNGFEAASEEEIFKELNFLEDHCVSFCTPSEIGSFIQQKEERIVSMIKVEDGATQLKIFNYETAGVEFRVGKLSRSCVEGIWANLNMELLYLTSDDDERFSIQQDKFLMRNITTQCANPPLGYPVYEATFRVNLFNSNIDQI